MSGTIGILIFIGAIFLMVFIHELGHFLAAKRFDIKVDEFFVGFGPRLYSRRKGETEYGLKAILLGGYVKIAGMNPWQTVPESDRPRTYGAKPAWQRAILLASGSASHLVLAFVLLFLIAGIIGEPLSTTTLAVIHEKVGHQISPAKHAGLRGDDTVREIEGRKITDWEQVRAIIRKRPGQPTSVVVERNGQKVVVDVVPAAVVELDEKGNEVTVGVIGVSTETFNRREPPHVAAWTAAKGTAQLTGWSVLVFGQVFSPSGFSAIFRSLGGRGERDLDDPSGIVGGARLAGQAAEAGEIQYLLTLLAGIVVFVGLMNLAPLPPLDGGHLLMLLIEKVRGEAVDMRKVIPVAVLVLSFFSFLFLMLLYLDIVRPVTNPFQ